MGETTMFLRIRGLSEEEVQNHFTDFFTYLGEKYPDRVKVSASVLTKGTEAERLIRKILDVQEAAN
ncbi:hypothetical protein [Enterococcus gilvus]|uniref:hypothetical protein n=1 Tax=Enterococcus gilvus TaxID=160453 RepID=UPI003EDABB3C